VISALITDTPWELERHLPFSVFSALKHSDYPTGIPQPSSITIKAPSSIVKVNVEEDVDADVGDADVNVEEDVDVEEAEHEETEDEEHTH
jgi:hypothetical protein